MAKIVGGLFWVGDSKGSADEKPRFLTRVPTFCLDRTEVTVRAYDECVTGGACEAAHSSYATCNAERKGKQEHPINCVNFYQAQAYCQSLHRRLPTEIEWEYAARGGDEELTYPWGDDSPDGRACWKRNGSCPVASFAPGAFGLFDIVGNVWEWTSDWFGPYPWPPRVGYARIYRGGSWSRRFEKWMKPQLRNRSNPKKWGSHLGFRCAKSIQPCAFGTGEDGACLRGVLDMECDERLVFNGVRCALRNGPTCLAGFHNVLGYGCELNSGPPEPEEEQLELDEVKRERTPEFDADCHKYFEGQPQAYRFTGATHKARTLVGREAGCRNRDVGDGWNSACCP